MKKDNLKLKTEIELTNNSAEAETTKSADIKENNVNSTSFDNYVKDAQLLFLNKFPNILAKLKSKSVLVIEIDQSEIRILHLVKSKHLYNIGTWTTQSLTQTNIEKTDEELSALRKLIDKKLLNISEVILTLHGPEVIIRTITVPKLKGKELKEAVYWKNKNELSNISDEALYDYEIIGEKEEKNKKVYTILTILARDAFIRKKIRLLNELNIYPQYVFTKPIALTSALKHLTNKWALEEKTTVLAEIGRETTLLCFFKDGKLEFVRSLMFGSDKIDRALNNPIKLKDKTIKINPNNLNIYKQRHGIVLELLENTTKSFFPYRQLFNFIQPILQMFVSELKRSFTFYLNSYEREKIDLFFITGSGTKLKNIDKYLQLKLEVPVYSIAPAFPSILQNEYKLGYEYTACFGAGARELKNFNFLPEDIKKENKYRQSQNSLKLAVLLIFISILVYSSLLYFEKEKYTKDLSNRESRYEKLHPSELKYQEVLDKIKAQEKKKRELLGNVSIHSKLKDILKIFSNITPKDIALTSIDYVEAGAGKLFEGIKREESLVEVKGTVYKNFLSADITLIEFINALKKLNYFREITLVDKTKRIEDKIFLFKIHCRL